MILFGGRVAEELVLEQVTTGAGNDIEKATDLVRRMVCEWGMSEKLGPMTFGKKEEEIFLGRDFTQKSDYSKNTAIEIDAEVGTLNVKLTDAELAERKTKWAPRQTNHTSGALWKYAQQVGPAVDGAVTHPGGAHEKQCYADI